MNKRGGETADIYDEIGQNLSVYFENMSKCFAIFEEEEKHAKEVYVGTDSVGKRALQRVLMKKKLEQMAKDLRELMVYQSPPELGPLFSDVEEMMKKIGEEQKVAIAQKMHQDRIDAERRRKRNERMIMEITWGIGVIIMSCCIGLMFAMVVGDRIKKYPQLGDGWIPTTPQERAEAARPRVWTGR
jgi:hypothetical protein